MKSKTFNGSILKLTMIFTFFRVKREHSPSETFKLKFTTRGQKN